MIEINVPSAGILLDLIDNAILSAMDIASAETPKVRKPRKSAAKLSVVKEG